ncbi:hypothetical protein GQ600_3148 [Phytophthora cactorum]|nr:hypothetical protein GQ600_3148 [Phytophthora cactorum]
MTNLLLTEDLMPSDIVSSCFNGGPSAAAICIRAGWTLPGVQDTYIRYEAAGDRIVGRYVAGLPFEETEARSMFFGVLPDLPIRDVTANNRQRRKNQLKWARHCKKLEQVGVILMWVVSNYNSCGYENNCQIYQVVRETMNVYAMLSTNPLAEHYLGRV